MLTNAFSLLNFPLPIVERAEPVQEDQFLRRAAFSAYYDHNSIIGTRSLCDEYNLSIIGEEKGFNLFLSSLIIKTLVGNLVIN